MCLGYTECVINFAENLFFVNILCLFLQIILTFKLRVFRLAIGKAVYKLEVKRTHLVF